MGVPRLIAHSRRCANILAASMTKWRIGAMAARDMANRQRRARTRLLATPAGGARAGAAAHPVQPALAGGRRPVGGAVPGLFRASATACPCSIAPSPSRVSAVLNVVLALRYPASHRLTNREATFYLAFDVLQLAALLYLTGGITNPFALMFLAPVVIAAATLNLGNTLILAGIAFASVSLISVVHRPLPWPAGEALLLPQLYQAGIWAALVIGIGFTSVYAWRIASEAARMSAGLAATQLALSREHRLASLGALATAAAHELGTPLGTIAVVARELERALPENSAEVEDVRLLREQAERCRAIIARLANPEEAHAGRDRAPAAGRVAGRHRRALSRRGPGDHGHAVARQAPAIREPQVWRAPELLHGLGNIIENAADFAKSRGARAGALGCQPAAHLRSRMTAPASRRKFSSASASPTSPRAPAIIALGETEIGPARPLGRA